ncbi:MAG: phosphatidylglycerol lysyltransferase domain-containing protein [Oscillospiraceae bacterium]|nr:phosphatidylglycerol lysyltransferase domain-containing protein [Oscillospiraceae bacterium]
MINFKDVELSDKTWARELLAHSNYRGCEYTFGNCFIWQAIYGTQIARVKDFYFIKSGLSGKYFFPAGRGDFREAVELLRADAAREARPLEFVTMNKASMEWLRDTYPDEFQFSSDRGFHDYVYNFEDLAELKGRKYHSKRNFINRFYMNNWQYEPVTPLNIGECAEMSAKWLEENDSEDGGLRRESCVVRKGLDNFFSLDFVGGLLRVDGEVIAFTFGEQATSDTFVVHVEKAFARIQGAYPAINNEFVNYACADYAYINREEDMGLENLRKAKMSYQPVFLEEKFSAVQK